MNIFFAKLSLLFSLFISLNLYGQTVGSNLLEKNNYFYLKKYERLMKKYDVEPSGYLHFKLNDNQEATIKDEGDYYRVSYSKYNGSYRVSSIFNKNSLKLKQRNYSFYHVSVNKYESYDASSNSFQLINFTPMDWVEKLLAELKNNYNIYLDRPYGYAYYLLSTSVNTLTLEFNYEVRQFLNH